jgi:hypothetical protein
VYLNDKKHLYRLNQIDCSGNGKQNDERFCREKSEKLKPQESKMAQRPDSLKYRTYRQLYEAAKPSSLGVSQILSIMPLVFQTAMIYSQA